MCLPSGEYATKVTVRNLNVGSKRSFVGRELLSGQKIKGCLKILAVALPAVTGVSRLATARLPEASDQHSLIQPEN